MVQEKSHTHTPRSVLWTGTGMTKESRQEALSPFVTAKYGANSAAFKALAFVSTSLPSEQGSRGHRKPSLRF